MNYSKPQIILASSLSGLSEIQSSWLCTFLDEAVKQLGTIQAETLTDFFGQFCVMNDVTEDEMKSRKKVDRLAKLRIKYCILAKEAFPDVANKSIGAEIKRDASSVWCTLENERVRMEKQNNLKSIKKRGHLSKAHSNESVNRLTNQIIRVFPKFFDNFEGWEYGNGSNAGDHFKSIYNKAKKLNEKTTK